MNKMTVGELQKLLSKYDDDDVVFLTGLDNNEAVLEVFAKGTEDQFDPNSEFFEELMEK